MDIRLNNLAISICAEQESLVIRKCMITKELVKQYWDNEPCGTRGIPYPVGSFAYYETIAEKRDRLVPFIAQYAQFDKWKGKKVLEVGCGVGSDLIRFAQAGAYAIGIDLSPRSVFLTRERLHLYKYKSEVIEADAENIPYKDNTFDFCWSCGVLHHTPNIKKAISEIHRVIKSGGEICVILYHRRSLVALQMYLVFGLFAMKPWRSIDNILAHNHESLGTKAYTVDEVRRMFSMFKNLEIITQVSSYDLRYGRDKYLPNWVGKLVLRGLGWFIVVRGKKP